MTPGLFNYKGTVVNGRHAVFEEGGWLRVENASGAVPVDRDLLVYPIVTPNGVGLSPDEKTVYVADTETSRIYAWNIVSPGKVKHEPFPAPYGGRCVCGLPGFQRFDSLALEANGNICVATLVTGYITVISPSGQVVRQVKMPDVYPTNICFGGPDLRTAYITLSASGQLAAMDWPEPGLRLNFMA